MTQPPLLSPLLPLSTIAAGLIGHPALSGTPATAWRRWDRALHLACLEGWPVLPSQIPEQARDSRRGLRDLRGGLLWRHPTAGYVRCDEGGQLADFDDRPIPPPVDGLLRLAHPHDTPPEVWAAWLSVLTEFVLLPVWWQAPEKITDGDVIHALCSLPAADADTFTKIVVILRRSDPPAPAEWPPYFSMMRTVDPKTICYQLGDDADAALAAVPGATIAADLACIGFSRSYLRQRESILRDADRERPDPSF